MNDLFPNKPRAPAQFPETWFTDEDYPHAMTLLGESAIDPDVYVAKDEHTGKTHWVMKHSGSVIGRDGAKVFAFPTDHPEDRKP